MVERSIDGDTIELADGQRVRYLLVDTPESTVDPADCYGPEAAEFNEALVEGELVSLSYDVECTDFYDRLLAWVEVDGREVNSLLVERGYACVLHIPPNGEDRVDELLSLQAAAMTENRGMWAVCDPVSCL
jgi:micrococcal nuclease